ncbi:MAG: GNAT family N-acetyltransferase [Ilumatobacteraceae bacterium]
MFCDGALAERIERAEVDLISAHVRAAHRRQGEGAGFLIPVGGGMASFADDGSPFNKVVGLGFDGVPDVDALETIERAFGNRGLPTQVELADLADPEVGIVLTGRGYRLESFENVLGRAIDGSPEAPAPPGIEVRSSGNDEFEAWLRVVADAAAQPDTEGLPWHEDFPRDVYERAQRDSFDAGVLRFAALRNGTLAGGAELRITHGIAQFVGAATAHQHRRQGIQTALLHARLAVAAATGCDIAIIVTQPGSKSQQNSQRCGFDLLYTRAVLVKQPTRYALGHLGDGRAQLAPQSR